MRNVLRSQAPRDAYLCACGVNPCSGCCWWSDGSPLCEDAAQEGKEDAETDENIHLKLSDTGASPQMTKVPFGLLSPSLIAAPMRQHSGARART